MFWTAMYRRGVQQEKLVYAKFIEKSRRNILTNIELIKGINRGRVLPFSWIKHQKLKYFGNTFQSKCCNTKESRFSEAKLGQYGKQTMKECMNIIATDAQQQTSDRIHFQKKSREVKAEHGQCHALKAMMRRQPGYKLSTQRDRGHFKFNYSTSHKNRGT